MNYKMNFANTLAENNQYLSAPNMTECERYGMAWGCDKDCPVFQRKECEMQEEVEKQIKESDNK